MKKDACGDYLLVLFLVLWGSIDGSSCADSPTTAPRFWIVIEIESVKANDDWDQQACLHFDLRGRYGQFALIVGGTNDLARIRQDQAVSGARILAEYHESKQLSVVECHWRNGVNLVSDVQNGATASQLRILFQHQDLLSGKTSFVIEGPVITTTSLAQLPVAVISVPMTPQLPMPDLSKEYSRLHSKLIAEPNKIVSMLVNEISQEKLKSNVESLSAFFTRLATSTTVREAEKWIHQQLTDLGLQVSTFPFRAGYSSNVIGELKGADDPSKIIVISAHYDSRTTTFNPDLRAPGADDNGSGSSNVLEIARVFTQSKIKFKYTLRFCLWSGEEQGLYGSRAYAAAMKQDGVDIIAVLNGDMLGWQLPKTNITVGMSNRFISKPLNDLVNTITRTYVPSLGIGPTSACCSDHQSFYEQGYPAVGYAENTGLYTDYPFYHKSDDLPSKLNFQQITLISKAIAAAAATLAEPLSN
jgi:hypothetical protein